MMDWAAILIAAVGGGALVSLINGFFGIGRAKSDIAATLMSVAENRIQAYEDRAVVLETRQGELEGIVKELRNEILAREQMIEKLQKENESLKREVRNLVAENKEKDQQIAALTERITMLEEYRASRSDG